MGANKFWSTNISRKREDCRIWLLYQGGLMFSDTVKEVHLGNYKIAHPRPAPSEKQPTPPPLPMKLCLAPGGCQNPSQVNLNLLEGRLLNLLLAGVTNLNKCRKIIREYAKANKQDSGSETETEF